MNGDGARQHAGRRVRVPRLWIRAEDEALVVLAGLPLVDAVFAGALSAGVFRSSAASVVFGLTCFAGAGCLAAAAALDGSARRRLAVVGRVYGVVGLGAVAGALALPWLAPFLLPNFEATVAPLVLIGVAYQLWPKKEGASTSTAESGRSDPTSISWGDAVRCVLTPKVALCVGVALSVLYAVGASRGGRIEVMARPPDHGELVRIGLAVGVGAGETAAGALVARAMERWLPATVLRRAGALALVSIAVTIVGAPLPSFAPLVLFAAAVALNGAGRAVRRLHARHDVDRALATTRLPLLRRPRTPNDDRRPPARDGRRSGHPSRPTRRRARR